MGTGETWWFSLAPRLSAARGAELPFPPSLIPALAQQPLPGVLHAVDSEAIVDCQGRKVQDEPGLGVLCS